MCIICSFSQILQLVDITLSFTMKMGIKKQLRQRKWSSHQPQHQVRIQPDKGPTLAENAFHTSTRSVCWGWPQQELWLQVGWKGHLQHYSSMITSCTLILDSKCRAAAKSTAARFIEDLERSQSQRVGHSETLSWTGRYPFIVYQSHANFLKFILIKHMYPLS